MSWVCFNDCPGHPIAGATSGVEHSNGNLLNIVVGKPVAGTIRTRGHVRTAGAKWGNIKYMTAEETTNVFARSASCHLLAFAWLRKLRFNLIQTRNLRSRGQGPRLHRIAASKTAMWTILDSYALTRRSTQRIPNAAGSIARGIDSSDLKAAMSHCSRRLRLLSEQLHRWRTLIPANRRKTCIEERKGIERTI